MLPLSRERAETRLAFLHQAWPYISLGLAILLFSLSIAFHYKYPGSAAEFFIGVITIIPISSFIRSKTERIARKLSCREYEFLSGLLGGLLGNSAELCFAVTAVVKGEPVVAQTALTGSLISNCLVIFGTCLLFGGLLHDRQSYPIVIARTNAQLLVVSLMSFVLPTAFAIWSQAGGSGLVQISRGTAVVLLLEFANYLWFFYYWHSDLDGKAAKQNIDAAVVATGIMPAFIPFQDEHRSLKEMRAAAYKTRQQAERNIYVDIGILAMSLVAMAFTSVYVVGALGAPSEKFGWSKSFVGLVVIPSIIGSVEHVVTAFRSHRDGIAWIVEVAFGSSIRVSLFVFPLTVVISWALGIADMNMALDGFQVTILCLTVILVNYVVHNGVIHWIEGTMFLASFLLFAIAVYYYPNNA